MPRPKPVKPLSGVKKVKPLMEVLLDGDPELRRDREEAREFASKVEKLKAEHFRSRQSIAATARRGTPREDSQHDHRRALFATRQQTHPALPRYVYVSERRYRYPWE